MTKTKTTLIKKDPIKGTATNNYPPTDDVENINSTNKGRDLLLANKPQIVPWKTERMLQRIQNHILNESKTRRKNLSMIWIDHKKAYDMSRKYG